MNDQEHWDAIYAGKDPATASWHRAHLERSLAWIDGLGLAPDARVVDAGGGASTLVEDLLARGFRRVTVVDLSARALEHAKARLGDRAARVRWIAGDVTAPLLDDDSVDLWHDRAVLHFFTDEDRRTAYVERLSRCLRPGGHAILATFGPGGPPRCSGLPVVRYTADALAAVLGPRFELRDRADELHVTPAGASQPFTYALFRLR